LYSFDICLISGGNRPFPCPTLFVFFCPKPSDKEGATEGATP
jgi:hypothetical protein